MGKSLLVLLTGLYSFGSSELRRTHGGQFELGQRQSDGYDLTVSS